mmetsp:Transcript_62548/g.117007  ORF Transcript_62548/g.117007 Transcript_62548/m.117007 type:complete len:339 (+) Transcript_62548:48-1064(+)
MAPRTLPSIKGSYYDVLCMPFDASEEALRHRYHAVIRALHPDKSQPRNLDPIATERFHQVQAAWRCLSDSTRRLRYDLRTFGSSSVGAVEAGPEGEKLLLQRYKEQAERDLRNMEVELAHILKKERKVKGIFIQKALYGNLQVREDRFEEALARVRTIEEGDVVGPWIDVTTAVQCLVDQHRIVIHSSSTSSKADLPGFYNPVPLDTYAELSLYVLYKFRDTLHEVTVQDYERLHMPLRTHLLAPDSFPRGPFAASNVDLLSRRRELATAAETSAKRSGSSTKRKRLMSTEEAVQRSVKIHMIWRLHGQQGDVSIFEYRLVLLTAVTAAAVGALLFMR